MTLRANKEQEKAADLRRWLFESRLKEARSEEASEEEEEDEEEDDDLSCSVCGRLGGDHMFYNVLPGPRVMCSDCHDASPSPPEIDSFF